MAHPFPGAIRYDKRAEAFNRMYRPGTRVSVSVDHAHSVETKTKGLAFKIEHGFAAVQVQLEDKFFYLTEVRPLEPPNVEPN